MCFPSDFVPSNGIHYQSQPSNEGQHVFLCLNCFTPKVGANDSHFDEDIFYWVVQPTTTIKSIHLDSMMNLSKDWIWDKMEVDGKW